MPQPNQETQPMVDDIQPPICSSNSCPLKEKLKNILMNKLSINRADEMLVNLLKDLMLLSHLQINPTN